MPHVDVVVIDGTNIAHRAWHAAGESPYQASVTFTTMVRTAIRTHTPRYACVAFDDVTCFRRRLFPAYKGQRPEKAEPLQDWLESLRGLETIAGARVNVARDHEADDVLATLASQARAGIAPLFDRLTVLLCTSDSDAYALVGGVVAVGLLSSGAGAKYVGSKAIREKLGIPSWQVPAYKALVGDSSDNVPGVPGIGPKRAVALLAPTEGMPCTDALRDALDRLTAPPCKVSVEEGREMAMRAYEVIRLKSNAPVRWSLADCRLRTAE